MNKEKQFNELVVQNKDRLTRICSYYSSNADDSKDMYQEILVNVWNSLENFKGDSSINTWIYRVAINTALTFTGKAYKHMKLIVSTDTQNLSSLTDDQSLEEKLLQEKKFKILQNELNLLTVIDKALISLMLEGLSMKEISDVIGITEPNVRVKIHRIKQQLRSKLKGENHAK